MPLKSNRVNVRLKYWPSYSSGFVSNSGSARHVTDLLRFLDSIRRVVVCRRVNPIDVTSSEAVQTNPHVDTHVYYGMYGCPTPKSHFVQLRMLKAQLL